MARPMSLLARLVPRLVVLGTLLSAGSAHSQATRVVALGDSNTAGYGVGLQAAFPGELEAMLRTRGYNVEVSNAGEAATQLAACSLASNLPYRLVRRLSSFKAATTICAEEAPLILSPGTWRPYLPGLGLGRFGPFCAGSMISHGM